MSTRFPQNGDFRDFLLHEMLFSLITSRFSGSLEIDYPDGTRIFHFDSGSLCAASSTLQSEQLDRIIERDKSPQLPDNKRKLIEDRVASGQKYSKAMVESGLMSATELLDYNRRQASVILGGSLADSPSHYRLTQSKSAQYRPLAIDPFSVIRKSILNDLDAAIVKQRLGDEQTIFIATQSSDATARAARDDAEIRSVISHLDGSRSLREVMKKVGLNPDRTARNLLFLKLMGMIQPAAGAGGDFVESPERLASATGGRISRYQQAPRESGDEESADILSLLGDDEPDDAPQDHVSGIYSMGEDIDDEVLISTPTPRSRQRNTPLPVTGKMEKTPMFGDVLSQQAVPDKRAIPGKIVRFVLPAVLIIISISAVAVIFFALQQRNGVGTDQKLSFYPEGMKTEQLPLAQEFSEKKEESASSRVEIPVKLDDAADRTAPVDPIRQNPAVKTAETPQANKPEEKIAEIPAAIPTATKTASPTVREPVTNTAKPAVKKPDIEPRRAQTPVQDNRTWDEAQPLALNLGVAGKWRDAAAIWRGPVSRLAKGTYTILVSQTDQGSFISSVFERFANSASLRDQFFVTTLTARSFNICWGFYPDRAAAQKGLQGLPDRVKQFDPVVRPLDDLR